MFFFLFVSYVGAFVLGASMFRIETSVFGFFSVYGLFVSVMSIKCLSLSVLINFSLKSILLAIRIATPACFFSPFDWKNFS